MSGVCQPRTQPERRHHRQSKRQERGKRGAWIDPHGYDAGKKIKGKKRHILVDTQGLLLHALVHSADIQDRDGGVLVMATLFGLHPFLLKLYADGGYQGPIFQSAVRKILRQIDMEIVKRSDIAKGFAVLPKRWIVTPTIACSNGQSDDIISHAVAQWSNESQEWQLASTFDQPAHCNGCNGPCGIVWLPLH